MGIIPHPNSTMTGKEKTMTKNGYVLSNWHKKCLKAFADKHGVDAMIDVVFEFEKTGSLGRAMVNVKSKMT